MQLRKETRPSRQARGRETRNTDMVAQPARVVTREDAMLALGAAVVTFALVTWGEAGAVPAALGTATAAAAIAALDRAFEGVWSR